MSHNITPELRQWITEESKLGRSSAALVEAMTQAGWTLAIAQQAIEQHERADHLRQPLNSSSACPTAAKFPSINLKNSPRGLDLGDRQVKVLLSLHHPQIVVLEGLLSDEECEALIEAAHPRMQRSLIVHNHTGADEESPERTSRGMFFERSESPLIARIEARLARLVDWPLDHGEGLQVLHYRQHAEYRPHYDYFDPKQPGSSAILQRGGQRLATVLLYLNNPTQGGGTVFPDLRLEVAPHKGNAVFFSYPIADATSLSLHGGAPLVEGEKWVATKWLRENVFN